MGSRAQNPIHSIFNASSTAEEVIDGLNLKGKIALITGGHSGLGFESAKVLAKAGFKVIVRARNTTAAQEKFASISNVSVIELDLADLRNVELFSNKVLALGVKVDMLICNAGIMACPESRLGRN